MLLHLLAGLGAGFWIVQVAVTVWMLVDAIMSSSNSYWFFLILFFQPLGAWVYFFAVKLQDFVGPGRSFHLARPAPIEQLRYNLRSNPCITNKVALANRLLDKGELGEARDLYQQVLKFDDTSKEGLYGLGRVLLQQGEKDAGLQTLQALLKLDPAYRDHQAAEIAAEAQWALGQQGEAIESLEKLVRIHPRFTLMTTLARFLIAAGRKPEARTLLQQALDDFRHSPRYVKRMNRGWPTQARALLTQT